MVQEKNKLGEYQLFLLTLPLPERTLLELWTNGKIYTMFLDGFLDVSFLQINVCMFNIILIRFQVILLIGKIILMFVWNVKRWESQENNE